MIPTPELREEDADCRDHVGVVAAGPQEQDGLKPGQARDVARKRTRTGCLTCRRRRVKCDEAQPKCARCVKANRVCEGYVNTSFDPGASDAGQVPRQISYVWSAPTGGQDGNRLHSSYAVPEFRQVGVPAGVAYSSAAPGVWTGQQAVPAGANGGQYVLSHITLHEMPPQGSDETQLSRAPTTQAILPPNLTFSEEIEAYLSVDDTLIPGYMVPSLFAPPPSHADADSGIRTTAFPYYLAMTESVDPATSLVGYRPSPTQSPLMHPAPQRMFSHFVHVVSCQISLFERHVPDPARLILVASQSTNKMHETNIWTYQVPLMALQTPALLHAILAVSALHIAGLSTVKLESAAAHQHASLLHYHLGIRRLSKALRERKNMGSRRIGTTPSVANGDMGIFAATLVLAHYEITTGEYDKWARHLMGASNLIREWDIPAIIADLAISDSELDQADRAASASVFSKLTAEERAAEQAARARRSYLRQRKSDAILFMDLLYFYLRMQIMQAIALDTAPYIESEFWDQIPSRTTNDTIRLYDSSMKLTVRLLHFIVRESNRKRNKGESNFTFAVSCREWGELDALYLALEEEFLETRHPANGVPLAEAGASLFGPPLWYPEIQDGVLRMYLAMWRLFLVRNKPGSTTYPAMTAGLSNVRETAQQGMLSTMVICRTAEGIVMSGAPRRSVSVDQQQQSSQTEQDQDSRDSSPGLQDSNLSLRYVIRKNSPSLMSAPAVSDLEGKVGRSPTSAAAWVCMSMPLLYAGPQIQDKTQRAWLCGVLEETYVATGWKTAMIIREGLEHIWAQKCTPDFCDRVQALQEERDEEIEKRMGAV
ncbi:fungal-specific transcription factor domain-containing protein [Myxozyma melibiosi]|uniref:Fungal-specific transcription factor domain-containing protein n=1 Tax=Myxozyma melibiosi TaxID=54550 RepID=A0ABR1F0F0_9ASCO